KLVQGSVRHEACEKNFVFKAVPSYKLLKIFAVTAPDNYKFGFGFVSQYHRGCAEEDMDGFFADKSTYVHDNVLFGSCKFAAPVLALFLRPVKLKPLTVYPVIDHVNLVERGIEVFVNFLFHEVGADNDTPG